MNISKNLKQYQSLFALLILCTLISILSDKFLSVSNLWNVLRQISVNIIISVGMTMVILTAGIDLSVGSILALCGAVSAGLLKFGLSFQSINLFVGFTTFGAILSALLLGLSIGLFIGLCITRFNVPPFVVTLAMLTIGRGLTMLYTDGKPISGLGANYTYLGTGWLMGVPVPVWISAIIVFLAHFFTQKTKTGRYIYAIGSNEKASYLSGIEVNKVKLLVYAISGTVAALGAVLVTSRLDSAQPNAGLNYELDAIAAVVIGGASLSGGKGNILGTVLGAIIIGVLNNGLVLLDVSPFWQQIVKGLVILVAVLIDRKGVN